MAISFISEEFKQKVSDLLSFFEAHNIDYDSTYLPDDEDEETEDEVVVIDEDYMVPVWFPHSELEDYPTLGELFILVNDAKEAVEFNENKLISKRNALYTIDDQELILSSEHNIPSLTELIDGQNYSINIVNGLTSYGIKLIINNLYDQYLPPVDEFDFFIEITVEDTIDASIVDDLVNAYLFELKSTLGISVHLAPRLSYITDEVPEFKIAAKRLRPMLRGKGIDELLRLYNSSLSSMDYEILVLTYTKVIEYVSQTVIQEDLINSVTKKLLSPRALNPDANYILELGKIFESNRNNQKDFLAIKLTMETCCDLNDIATIAPPFLESVRKLRLESNNDDKAKALKDISNAISHTRNMFAHAKTNYEKKGMECPADQLKAFSKCLDVLAQQVIRWFAKEHEDNRVV
ncbi:hypothetical protein AB1K89_00850 [Sporosarcina sp. 179-K 8C2 HS]|uniref:hypothetical protein n=1 Tax=Sporosarcina sp. 179-K 8C2 HS TaxID=3142387 RepID=UPI0039A3405E